MIQLTKGTNVLDINLSDFSGAGQDVVQNGSFNDIGSDLVQNGDFAEIGSELVTNGDFSAVPLTGGGELATFSLGNISLVNLDGSISTSLGGIDYRSVAIGDTNDARPRVQFDNLTEGKSYKIVYTPSSTSGASDFDLFQNGVRVVFNHDISLPLTFSLLAGASYNGIDFNGTNTFTTDYTLSIIEEINLVTNPNFTDTGSELVVNGDFLSASSWNVNSNWNINTALGVAEADGTSNADINQAVWLPVIGKSYRVTFEVVSLTQGRVLFKMGGVNGEGHTTIGIKTEYIVATSTDRLKIDSEDSFIGSVTNVSVKELGEDWVSVDDTNAFGENGLTMTSTEGLDVKIYQANVISNSKSYKVTYTIHENGLTGTNAIQYYTGSALNGYDDLPDQSVGTHTFYYTAPSVANDRWYFRLDLRSSTSTTDFVTISSLVVQELGEDWTVSTTGSSTLQFNSNGAAFNVVGGDYVLCRQDYGFINGKSYKLVITFTGDGTSKKFSIKDDGGSLGGLNEDITISSLIPTTQTFYFTANSYSDTTLIKRLSGGEYSFSVSSISVKEVGQDWTVGDGWTVEDDKAVYDGSAAGYSWINQDIGSVLNKSYKITFDAVVTSGSFQFKMGSVNADASTENVTVSSTNSYEVFLKSGGSSGSVFT